MATLEADFDEAWLVLHANATAEYSSTVKQVDLIGREKASRAEGLARGALGGEGEGGREGGSGGKALCQAFLGPVVFQQAGQASLASHMMVRPSQTFH